MLFAHNNILNAFEEYLEKNIYIYTTATTFSSARPVFFVREEIVRERRFPPGLMGWKSLKPVCSVPHCFLTQLPHTSLCVVFLVSYIYIDIEVPKPKLKPKTKHSFNHSNNHVFITQGGRTIDTVLRSIKM